MTLSTIENDSLDMMIDAPGLLHHAIPFNNSNQKLKS